MRKGTGMNFRCTALVFDTNIASAFANALSFYFHVTENPACKKSSEPVLNKLSDWMERKKLL